MRLMMLLLCLSPLQIWGQGVYFENMSLEKALEKAEEEGKLVFVDCYTKTCGPCAWMVENIFPLPEVGEYFNTTFVNIKVDLGTDEGKALKKRYPGINAVPTFLILKADGTQQHRFTGSTPADVFLERTRRGVNVRTSLAFLQAYSRSHEISNREMFDYWYALSEGRYGEEAERVANALRERLSEEEWTDAYFWPFVESNPYGSPEFERVLGNFAVYKRKVNGEKVDDYLVYNFFREIDRCFRGQHPNLARLDDIRSKVEAAEFDSRPRVLQKVNWVKAMGDQDEQQLYAGLKAYLPYLEDREFGEVTRGLTMLLKNPNGKESKEDYMKLVNEVLGKIKNEQIKKRIRFSLKHYGYQE